MRQGGRPFYFILFKSSAIALEHDAARLLAEPRVHFVVRNAGHGDLLIEFFSYDVEASTPSMRSARAFFVTQSESTLRLDDFPFLASGTI